MYTVQCTVECYFVLQMSAVVSEGVVNLGDEGHTGCEWQWDERNWIQEPCIK